MPLDGTRGPWGHVLSVTQLRVRFILAPVCTLLYLNEDFPGLYVHSWTWDTVVKDSHFIFKCTFKGKMNDYVISWLAA